MLYLAVENGSNEIEADLKDSIPGRTKKKKDKGRVEEDQRRVMPRIRLLAQVEGDENGSFSL